MTGGFLAIDCGNSRLKATWLPDEGVAERTIFSSNEVESIVDMVERCGVRHIGMSSVGNVDARLIETLRQTVNGNFMLVTPLTPLPIEINYSNVRSLGTDRKATAVAAHELYPGYGVLVIDAGSALTMDIVSADGVFVGGNISPGINMRFQALHQFTAALPLIKPKEPEDCARMPQFGQSTREAIEAGVILGIADEVIATVNRALDHGVSVVIITGGDARGIIQCVHALSPEILMDYQPDLLAMGIRAIYKYNEDKN